MTPDEMAAIHAAAMHLPRPWRAGEFAALCAGAGVFACTDPAGRGLALGRVAAGEAELLTLAVLPEARRRGIGQTLLAAFTEGARARGAQMGFLEVAATNAPARALYARAGWVEAGRRRGYYAAPGEEAVDAVVMRRTLG
jgi:ribosomal-protein-alanine N-acetyltransferase